MEPRGATILLVEDNPDHAEFALKAFKKSDLPTQIIWAKDGQEALDVLEGPHGSGAAEAPLRPDVVLLDIHLPKVNGHEVLRRVKSNEALRTIPVVMLSTSEHADDVRESYRAGANSYVTKSVSFKDLVEQVKLVKEYWLLTNTRPASSVTQEDRGR